MKRKLAPGYLNVTFMLKVRNHLHKSEILHVNKIIVNKRAFCFRERNRIQIHPKISITDGI